MNVYSSKFVIRVFVVIAIIVANGPAIVLAKDDTSTTKGLAISPIRTEIEVDPGKLYEQKLQLSNYSKKPITVRLSAQEFNVTDRQYDYEFKADSGISKWISFAASSIVLEPEKSKLVTYELHVPIDAEPGGHYLSLFVTNDTQTAPGEIRTQQRIGSLLYITVKGEVTRIGSLKYLESPFIFDGLQPWTMVVANTGTTHFRSKYSASIRNIFDNHEVAAASSDALVLPQTERKILASMPLLKYVGVYKVVHTVGLGDSPAAKREYIIVFVPKQAYGPLVSLSIICVAGVAYLVWKSHRRNTARH